MSRLPLVRLSSALPLLALLACKLGKDNEQTDRPLPAPEPASTTPPSRPVEAEPPRDRPKEPTPRSPSEEGSPASPKPATPTPTATAISTADAAAPAATDAGAPAAGTDRVNQCITKCQGSLSACLSKPVPLDAGVPSLESMAECKKAFEDCRTACTP